ncbi:hypothetical protein N9M31_07675 [Alphaproteobacteria bacterium]|nr:hypothetical protein [Alphaproteobacteria bacterium]
MHFDRAFYYGNDLDDLDTLIRREADYLNSLCGIRPIAFSFHNPIARDLDNEAEPYGGLVNYYSKWFKKTARYCSDSNGYWRYERLFDVLTEGGDECFQVVTHAGWWHEAPSPPRSRVIKDIYERSSKTIQY